MVRIDNCHYYRRCKDCWYPDPGKLDGPFPLPPLNKKVVYLDQMAVSNMMKSINPNTRASKEGRVEPFWRRLYERLDILTRMQLILCPDSIAHTDESLLGPHFDETKRLYQQLSHGSRFDHFHDVKRSQFHRHAIDWLKGIDHSPNEFEPLSIVHGKIDVWQDNFFFSSNLRYDVDYIDSKRASRTLIHDDLCSIHKRWQKEKGKEFDDWFQEECLGIGKGILKVFFAHQSKIKDILDHKEDLPIEDTFQLIGPLFVEFVWDARDAFADNRLSERDALIKAVEYFQSSKLEEVPFVKIHSLLTAALARKAAHGQRRPPSPGMNQDLETISVLLPYCDAMFLDRECHSLLCEGPLLTRLDYGTRLFSKINKDEFFEYLDQIEQSASEVHLAALEEVYGERKPKPNTSLFSDGKIIMD